MQKTLSRLLQAATILGALFGGVLLVFVLPQTVQHMAQLFPEYAASVTPATVGIGLGALPVYVAACFFFVLCGRLAKGFALDDANRKLLKRIALCAGAATLYAVLFMVWFCLAIQPPNPGIALMWLAVVGGGSCCAVVGFLLSLLVKNNIPAAAVKS